MGNQGKESLQLETCTSGISRWTLLERSPWGLKLSITMHWVLRVTQTEVTAEALQRQKDTNAGNLEQIAPKVRIT